ncbi:uncharacterized protein FSUBG_10312 [Fusarium subglutinans]|uniref:NYN domain-containing protein n=1 Tax=Gibberella subglutinans TaxID=42677 RepID=A0A8H5ULQ8_GIBSU|nr:uncharacterized protein FSUBG_10312 [Fusarium subglutinans]KAF5592008.1 hypothetical protein FSUBG_10312 [Fusarium subglutinans]
MANAQNAGLSGTPPDPNIRFFVYLDESNFRISGEAENKKRRGLHPKAPLSWHYDIRVLKGIIRKHSAMNVDKKLKFMVYGSNIEHGLVHQDLELHTSKSAVFAIISGDSDMRPAVRLASQYGHTVHVWAWEDSLSGVYRELERQGLISLHLLDGFLDDLTMRNTDIPVGNASIPRNGIVLPNHWKSSLKILDGMSHELTQGKFVSVKRSNDGRNYCTDVAFLLHNGLPNQDVLFRCVLKNLQDQGLHAMSFVEYFYGSTQLEVLGP